MVRVTRSLPPHHVKITETRAEISESPYLREALRRVRVDI